jgi:hypothetical protein
VSESAPQQSKFVVVAGTAFPLIHDHDPLPTENSLFDVESFLLHICLDPVGRVGLFKAFLIKSKNSDGKVSLEQLYEVKLREFLNMSHNPKTYFLVASAFL